MILIQSLVIAFIFGFILIYNVKRPRVMILHSYSTDHPEVIAFNRGYDKIKNGLKTPYVVRTYMNALHLKSKKEGRKAGQKAQAFIEEFGPHIIVAVGEEAQEYLGRYYAGDKDIHLIFSNIRYPHFYGYKKAPNVSGIEDALPLDEIKVILKKHYREEAPSVVVSLVGDGGLRHKSDLKDFKSFEWNPLQQEGLAPFSNFEAWKAWILEINEEDRPRVILLSSHAQLRKDPSNDSFIPPQEVVQWTKKHSKHPLVGLHEEDYDEGIALSLSPSAEESGARIAKYVRSLINAPERNAALTEKTREFLVSVQKGEAFKLSLPKSFEALARSNKRYREESL